MVVLTVVIFRLIKEQYVLSRKRFKGAEDYLTELERKERGFFCRFVSVSREIGFSSSVARHRNCLLHVLHMCLS